MKNLNMTIVLIFFIAYMIFKIYNGFFAIKTEKVKTETVTVFLKTDRKTETEKLKTETEKNRTETERFKTEKNRNRKTQKTETERNSSANIRAQGGSTTESHK